MELKYGFGKCILVPSWQGMMLVMFNFVCQLDWATGYPDIWPNIILSMSVEVPPDEIHIWTGDWVKQIALRDVGGPHPISGRPEENQKADPPRREFLTSLSWNIGLLLLDSNWNISSFWISSLLAFCLELMPWALLAVRPQTTHQNIYILFLCRTPNTTVVHHICKWWVYF